VLLLDERGSGTGADRPPADSSVSSNSTLWIAMIEVTAFLAMQKSACGRRRRPTTGSRGESPNFLGSFGAMVVATAG
jgi:hypothetical protein